MAQDWWTRPGDKTIGHPRVARAFWVAATIFARKTLPYDSILSQNRRGCLQQEDRTSSKYPTRAAPRWSSPAHSIGPNSVANAHACSTRPVDDPESGDVDSTRTSRIGREVRRRGFVAWPWDHYARGHRATQSSCDSVARTFLRQYQTVGLAVSGVNVRATRGRDYRADLCHPVVASRKPILPLGSVVGESGLNLISPA
jgi:hypothetical protein